MKKTNLKKMHRKVRKVQNESLNLTEEKNIRVVKKLLKINCIGFKIFIVLTFEQFDKDIRFSEAIA